MPQTLAGERVDRAVALLTGYSRADVAALCARGAVLVDGEAAVKSRRLREGEIVAVTGAPEPPEPPGPEPVPVEVRYEDEFLAVVSKPAGLVVHPGAGNEHGTLVHGVLHRWPHVAEVGERSRPGIVHRLDRDTSGLLAVALTPGAYAGLVEELSSRRVERAYLALVCGQVPELRGMVDAPVGRSARQPTRMAVTPAGREARTRYEVVEQHARTTLLDVSLETGRTHQIRVHLAAIDHPVVGDPVYGGGRDHLGLERPFLHARRLAFDHPVTGERIVVDEALPDELSDLLARLRAELL